MSNLSDDGTYTSGDQRADTAFLVGVSYARADERRKVLESLNDPLCDALAAAREGLYDMLSVEDHLESLIERLYGRKP